MRVLISKTATKINGYNVFDHISNLTWMGVDTLIFHSCVEDEVTFVFAINSLPATVKTLIYINANLNPLYYDIFKGKGAYIYQEESFLAEKDTLDFLVDSAGTTGCEVKSASSDLNTLESFIEKLTTSDPDEVTRALCNKNWVATLENVVQSMSTSLTISDQTSTKLVEFVDNVNKHIGTLEQQNERTAVEIQKLRETVNSLSAKQLGQNIQTTTAPLKYGTYTIPSIVKNVVYIRCFGDVDYLTTFLLAFQGWLGAARNGKGMKSKLLIVRPPFANYMARYNKIAKITSTGAGMFDINKSKDSVFVTYEPNKKVLDAFFKADVPVFFVVDFMQSDMPLIQGHMSKVFNAYSSPRIYRERPDEDKNKAPLTRSFFSRDGVNGDMGFVIPYIPGFQEMPPSERKGAYFKACKPLYEKLFNIMSGV